MFIQKLVDLRVSKQMFMSCGGRRPDGLALETLIFTPSITHVTSLMD